MNSRPRRAPTQALPFISAEADVCPRCGASFHCGARSSAPCPCGTLTLPPNLFATLRERYAGCLCLACLRELAMPT